MDLGDVCVVLPEATDRDRFGWVGGSRKMQREIAARWGWGVHIEKEKEGNKKIISVHTRTHTHNRHTMYFRASSKQLLVNN